MRCLRVSPGVTFSPAWQLAGLASAINSTPAFSASSPAIAISRSGGIAAVAAATLADAAVSFLAAWNSSAILLSLPNVIGPWYASWYRLVTEYSPASAQKVLEPSRKANLAALVPRLVCPSHRSRYSWPLYCALPRSFASSRSGSSGLRSTGAGGVVVCVAFLQPPRGCRIPCPGSYMTLSPAVMYPPQVRQVPPNFAVMVIGAALLRRYLLTSQ